MKEKTVYRSPYEAYPFLSDPLYDLKCDFELMTDELASGTGLLRAHIMEHSQKGICRDKGICDELEWVCEIIYHMNPTLRTSMTVTAQECERLKKIMERLEKEVKGRCDCFVLPVGGSLACEAHLLRVHAKKLVRLIYRYMEYGNEVPDLLLDVTNLLSGYYFLLALWLNMAEKIEEIPFVSRNYEKSRT